MVNENTPSNAPEPKMSVWLVSISTWSTLRLLLFNSRMPFWLSLEVRSEVRFYTV